MNRIFAYIVEATIGIIILAGVFGYLKLSVKAWMPQPTTGKQKTQGEIWRWRILTLVGGVLAAFVIYLVYTILTVQI